MLIIKSTYPPGKIKQKVFIKIKFTANINDVLNGHFVTSVYGYIDKQPE